VRDSALLFDVLAGDDPRDPASARRTATPVISALDETGGQLRIGVVRDMFSWHVQPEVQRVALTAVERMRVSGAALIDVDLPHLRLTAATIMPLVQAEATSYHWPALQTRPGDFSDALRENLRLGALVLAKDYLDAQRLRSVIAAELDAALRDVDVLIYPTQPIVAPPIGVYEVAATPEDDVLDAEIGFTGPANLSGHPAISVPCGLTSDGLPVGMQFIGRTFDESTLLRVATAFESIADVPMQPPLG
jgi:aspartyl-tRNA(Asn)/glutamyl-tRNA(Gln) amidotransferase subunit A